MSLGCEYDMVLLTPRAPLTDNDIMYQQPRRRWRPGGRSRHARQAQRGQDHLDTARAHGGAPRSAGTPCPAVGTRSLVGDLTCLSLDMGETPAACGDAPSASHARLLVQSPWLGICLA